MLIHRMTASFGKLRDHTLELKDGLNIIEAPNESGKSTWCAFLLAMLYGVNSRERDKAGFIAAKNRYAPWSGVPMSGRLDCNAMGREISIFRGTSHRDRPMSDFSAVFAGNEKNAPDLNLNSQNCGEVLLGVTREVYERSAFIKQSGLPIGQSAELERRIAALITAGEEDTSYIEASETLKRQLNRRKYNRSGQIPRLRDELKTTSRQIDQADNLEARLANAKEKLNSLERREAALNQELRSMDQWEAAQKRKNLASAQNTATEAEKYAAGLRREMQDIPSLDTIARLRGAIVNLRNARGQVERAEEDEETARQNFQQAERNLKKSSFSGRTPREAEKLPLDLPPKPEIPLFLKCYLGMCMAAPISIMIFQPNKFIVALYVILTILGGGACWMILQREKSWNDLYNRRKERRETDLKQYADLYHAMEHARTELTVKASKSEALRAAYLANEKAVLKEVHAFAPEAHTLEKVDSILRDYALKWKELSAAETSARESGLRRDFLREQEKNLENQDLKSDLNADLKSGDNPPEHGREETVQALAAIREDVYSVRSEVDRLTGQLRMIGDAVVLRSAAAHSRDELDALEQEYAAIQLAMNSLNRANAVLHSRFSPALGRRAAEIFRVLTNGRYQDVELDRALRISTKAEGAYRDIGFLSEGAADQLYLAVRLAICDLVLPASLTAPVILDDALANFDDERCADALRFLKRAAQNRQILLFTCHSREAEFFERDPEISVRRLTHDGNMIR